MSSTRDVLSKFAPTAEVQTMTDPTTGLTVRWQWQMPSQDVASVLEGSESTVYEASKKHADRLVAEMMCDADSGARLFRDEDDVCLFFSENGNVDTKHLLAFRALAFCLEMMGLMRGAAKNSPETEPGSDATTSPPPSEPTPSASSSESPSTTPAEDGTTPESS